MVEDYLLCGWRVRSALPLPELIAWPSADQRPPDIVIDEGTVPETLERSLTPGRYLMVDPTGTVLLLIADALRFLIRSDGRVTVDRVDREDMDSWRLFFLGTVLGYLCHQRGRFPLHAATLRIEGRTLAIAGAPGAGKSTLAHALSRRGHWLVSDDVTVICDEGDRLEIKPAFPRLNLWASTLDAAGVDVTGLRPLRPQIEKYDVPLEGSFDIAPLPLDAIVILGEAPAPSLTKLMPTAALPAVQAHIAQRQVAAALGNQRQLFAATARIVSAVPVYRLQRPKRFEEMEEVAALIERGIA
ncbi:hypothetical protein DMC47_17060 [Nostoc sp. 3335mG]|nr:hypothetical protein DMC47_17060 [Nostoc sp. 3335mG]